jgi:hypothetical protein
MVILYGVKGASLVGPFAFYGVVISPCMMGVERGLE